MEAKERTVIMLNKIVLMGRLTADPELKRTPSDVSVTSFTVAVDRDFGGDDKKTDFINCVAWRNTAEFISKYFIKGRMICLAGRLEIRDWTDRDGNKRRAAEVNVESAYFADSLKPPKLEDLDDDDGDLPF